MRLNNLLRHIGEQGIGASERDDGKFREVQVRLTKPEVKGAKVRTRSGYLAPLAAKTP